MGKSTISMAIFHCYVSSPEGKNCDFWGEIDVCHVFLIRPFGWKAPRSICQCHRCTARDHLCLSLRLTVQGLLLFRQPNSFHLIHFISFYIMSIHVYSCLILFETGWFVDSSTRSHVIFSMPCRPLVLFWSAASLPGGAKESLSLRWSWMVPVWFFSGNFRWKNPLDHGFGLGAVETIR